MSTLAILLYCQRVHIVFRNTALTHIVLYCHNPGILPIKQYIQYITRDCSYYITTNTSCLQSPVSRTMILSTLLLQLHHCPSDFDDR